MRRPIGVIIFAVLLAALIYSQRDYLFRTLADEMKSHMADGGPPLASVPVVPDPREMTRDPEAAGKALRRAQRFLAGGELDSAATWLLRSQKADPDDPVAFRHLAVIRARQARPGDALREMSMALERDSSDVWTWLQIGKIQAQLGDNEAARKSWAQAVALDPGNVTARTLLDVTDKPSKADLSVPMLADTTADSVAVGD